jgi:zinc transport system ATP-binding protein
MSGSIVRMRGASVGYGDRPAVRDVDFSLDPGEVVVVLGPNGAGKSTLVRGILGLATLMDGELDLFGVPAAEFRERYRLGYVPQRHTVTGGIPSTVREVVATGRLPHKRAFSATNAADRAAVAAAIDTVGLAERADTPIGSLSGGQQRRALIARALAAEPDVLVMDEPTAGVDAANQEILAATLRSLVERGSTLLIVAHELGPLEPLISRVVVMRDGRIDYDGPPLGRSAVEHEDDEHVHHHLDDSAAHGGLGLGDPLP